MVRILEFNNTGNSTNSNSTNSTQKETVMSIATKAKFNTDEASEESGLVIAPNGMIAIEYDMTKGSIFIRPDNDLELDGQGLVKFKQDLSLSEKLAFEISKLK